MASRKDSDPGGRHVEVSRLLPGNAARTCSCRAHQSGDLCGAAARIFHRTRAEQVSLPPVPPPTSLRSGRIVALAACALLTVRNHIPSGVDEMAPDFPVQRARMAQAATACTTESDCFAARFTHSGALLRLPMITNMVFT